MNKKNFFLFLFLLFEISLSAQNGQKAVEKTPDEVYEKYEEAFFSQDIQQILKLYAENAVLISSGGNIHKGHNNIKKIYEVAFDYFPKGITFQTLYHGAEDNLLHRAHKIRLEETGEEVVPFLAETFVFGDGKIQYHTIADYYPEMDLEPPVALTKPPGWQAQTSTLPRYFAPNLYEGIADYAFAPGMFDPAEEDYFTYAMVFWLPVDTDVNEQKLERDLEAYFDGLAVAEQLNPTTENVEKKISKFFDSLSTRYSIPQDSLRTNVKLSLMAGDDKWAKSYNGSMQIYETLAADEPVDLNTKVRLQKKFGYPQADLIVEFPGPMQEDWDVVRLDQLMTNLITNALRHGRPGGPVNTW